MMRSGQSRMQIDSDVDTAIIDVIQALILFFVAAEVIVRWLIRSRTDNVQRTLTGGWGKSN
jgi:simple sugar transport system permease protein